MKTILTILIFLISTVSFAQKDTIYFTDFWRICTVDEAGYYRVYSKSKGKYLIDDYYMNNQLQMKTISKGYVQLTKEGKTVFYYKNGGIKSEGEYRKNKKEGEWEEWFSNGDLKSKGVFLGGKRSGVWKKYYKNGVIKSEGEYLDGNRIRVWKGFYKNEVVKYEKKYNEKGELDGIVKGWYDNKQLSFEKVYSGGNITKEGKSFHDNGAVNLVYFYDEEGNKIGDWKQYFPNGVLNIEGSFKLDEKNGVWLELYENGKTKIEGIYKKGLKHKEWNYLSSEGYVLAKIIYKNGDVSSKYFFDKNGSNISGKQANRLPFFNDDGVVLKDYLNLNLEIPNDSVVSGKTLISLTIKKDGTIEKVRSEETITPFIDSALVQVFKSIKSFVPGRNINMVEDYFLDVQVRLMSNNTVIVLEHYVPSNLRNDINIIRIDSSEELYMIVEEMPELPGGKNGGLQGFLAKEVRYPPQAKANGISGKVYINFTVRRTGLVTKVKIIKGAHEILEKEALRVVNEFPKWIPGSQEGVPVNVSYNLPINFRLR